MPRTLTRAFARTRCHRTANPFADRQREELGVLLVDLLVVKIRNLFFSPIFPPSELLLCHQQVDLVHDGSIIRERGFGVVCKIESDLITVFLVGGQQKVKGLCIV